MEILLIILAALIGLGLFDFLAVEFGIDSRDGSDERQAPVFSAI